MNIEELYRVFLNNPSVQTDTRKIKSGDLFFALKGPNFNGNQFAEKAIELGAAFAIIDEKEFENDKTILVDDVLVALQQLAKKHRESFNIPFIAITGSNGKTTTKELVHEVLSKKYKCYTTQGNLNNHIGIPLTILSIKKDAEIAVIEMGANHIGEIKSYCEYALPTHGIITNMGKAHLEGFGSEEGVRKGKAELFDFLVDNNGTGFIHLQNEFLKKYETVLKETISYSTENIDADYVGTIVPNEEFLKFNIRGKLFLENVLTQLVGAYNLPNALVAAALGNYFSVNGNDIKNALEEYSPSNSRSQKMIKGTNTIILDAYNANPSSMKAALENFASRKSEQKILMIGAMMELGEASEQEHKNIVDTIHRLKIKDAFLVGDGYSFTNDFPVFKTSEDLKNWINVHPISNSDILIKGSRGTKMELVLDAL